MNIVVLGLWHLGSVTAACCAKHFNVVGLDFDSAIVDGLARGHAPLHEPGLDELIAAGQARHTLSFTTSAEQACAKCDLLWVCYDTPVDEHDRSDVDFVLSRLRRTLPHLPQGAVVLVSAQLPVGTCARLEQEFPHLHFACSPENLRLGKALDAFEKADRAIVGTQNEAPRALLEQLFKPFAARVIFMRTESAEMVKHALNAFLALSITFINEIARVCERVGADAHEVAAGLKSEARIGPRAYLGPGGPFAGGTLARDVVTLTKLGAEAGDPLTLISAIKESNDQHRGWALRRLMQELSPLAGKHVAVLGLVYTPNTNTLRRSSAVELCQALTRHGAKVHAFDPAVTELPADLSGVTLTRDLESVLDGAYAAVVCTEWPQFRDANWETLSGRMRRKLFIDANRFLEKALQGVPALEHISVGKS